MEKTILIEGKAKKDAGYALFLGAGVLCMLSFLSLSVLALSRSKLDSLDRQRISFYSSLDSENEKVLSEWNNENQMNDGDERIEND